MRKKFSEKFNNKESFFEWEQFLHEEKGRKLRGYFNYFINICVFVIPGLLSTTLIIINCQALMVYKIVSIIEIVICLFLAFELFRYYNFSD